FVWPSNLTIFYPRTFPAWSWGQAAAAASLLGGISALVLRLAHQRPYLAVGWLWYLGTYVPVIGLVEISSHGLADRYTYVPHIGLYILAVWGLSDLLTSGFCPKGSRALLAAAILSSCLV